MTGPSGSGLYYPNRLARYLFVAMEDVIGQNGMRVVLNTAGLLDYLDNPPPDTMASGFDFAHLAALSEALETMYGPRGGRGMALRIGRAAFAQGMRSFGAMQGIVDPAFRSLPLDTRVAIALSALATTFSEFTDQQSTLQDAGNTYHFVVQPSPMAWNRRADRPVCNALAGILQECARWASNGREYYVYETACMATGHDACTFVINKKPIGQL